MGLEIRYSVSSQTVMLAKTLQAGKRSISRLCIILRKHKILPAQESKGSSVIVILSNGPLRDGTQLTVSVFRLLLKGRQLQHLNHLW